MEMEQELEWSEAQKIAVSEDLVAVAKQQLRFLAAVDRNRWLYEGPALHTAIYRYNICWLPLLAKHSESHITKGPLVVPLDCEWVWHCHRLNPVRYSSDCKELYGRILDDQNVVSSVQGTLKLETEEIWNKLYPNEPYNFNLTVDLSDQISEKVPASEKCTKYDLVSAVKRQIPFFYQVSRPHINNDQFLEAAVARYKGFLHLIKRNRERSINRFCVPTYDIDLIWHSHQLNPVSYCKDMVDLLGKVLEHDDTDSDRTKGKKLDCGFSETTKQWEETFGSRYWRAGAMYRGNAPSPVATTPCTPDIDTKMVVASNKYQKVVDVPEVKVVEVMLEFVAVRNLPEGHKGSLFVSFSKTQPDTFFNARKRLSIFSESGEKRVASFQCQPTGNMLFELVSLSPSNLPILRPAKTMGSVNLSLEEMLSPVPNLSVEKWLELVPSSGAVSSKPIYLRVAISITIPSPAANVLHMVRSRPFLKNSCFFPLPKGVQAAKSWTRVIDEAGNEVISLQLRDFKKEKVGNNNISRKEVIGITQAGETCTLAQFIGTKWILLDSQWSIQPQESSNKDGPLFELMGPKLVKFLRGRKLDYEPKHCEERANECDFLTAVEFSVENPYGRAVALLNLKSGIVKVNEEGLVLPAVTLAFILSDILRKEGYKGLSATGENFRKSDHLIVEEKNADLTTAVDKEVVTNMELVNGNAVISEKGISISGGCGGGCGSGCGGCGVASGNTLSSGGCGGCGSGCGGGCGSMKSGGCGSGCGSGCGGCGGRLPYENGTANAKEAPAQVNDALAA